MTDIRPLYRRFAIVTALLILLVSPAFAAKGDDTCDLRVGAAAIVLEADDSMVIGGSILPGHARGQEGQLRVVATVLKKPPQTEVAIVACDVLFVTRDFVDEALKTIENTTGIPPTHVLVNATHTHHAPSTAVVHGYGRDEVFVGRVRDGIVQAVQLAHARLARPSAPAQFLFHLGEENTIGGNSRRRLPDGMITWLGPRPEMGPATGPFDPQLPVLAFCNRKDELLSVIYNHSTHTIGTRRGRVRSPGFYGLAAQELEQELNTTITFLEGASGSTHNITRVPVAEAVLRLKSAIRESLKQATVRPVDRLASVKWPFEFTVRHFDEAEEDRKVMQYCVKYAPQRAESTIEVFRAMRKKLAPLQGQKKQTWLQVIAIGDVAIVGVPAEYFTGLGIDIKQRSPFSHTVIAELANDWIGYLPDREAHQLGGYQTWMGLHSYAEIGTGERMADEVVRALQRLHEEKHLNNQ